MLWKKIKEIKEGHIIGGQHLEMEWSEWVFLIMVAFRLKPRA